MTNGEIKVSVDAISTALSKISGLNATWNGASIGSQTFFSISKGKTIDSIKTSQVEMAGAAKALTQLLANTQAFIQKSQVAYTQADDSAMQKFSV